MSSLPLNGITVVSIEQAVAAPFATRQLADLGARVIKIERPGSGDFARSYDTAVKGMASHFVWLNRTKESVALDLKHPQAAPILEKLLERADVIVQNLAPGAADRLGLGSHTLRTRYPRLIICNISGFGASGPYAGKKAYDLIVQSEVGMLSVTGTADTPCKVGVSIADISAAMYAYSGILTALLARKDSGQGTIVDVSLFDSLGEWMGYPVYYTAYGGSQPERTGASHATIAPYGPFRTNDGSIVVAVHNDQEWQRFTTDVLRQPTLGTDPRFQTTPLRFEHRAAMTAAIERVLGDLTSAEVLERLETAGVANARVNSVREYLDHPQLAARDSWREIESPVGPLKAMRPPARIDGVEPAMSAIPTVGQHTDTVLTELGFDRNAVARLREEGVI
jgi:itaconate CoA-transferase